MLTYCVPLIPTAVFWWIMGVSDRYLVKWFVESDANGIYAVAYKIPTILTILATVFMDAWQLSAIAESGDRRAQARFYARVWDAFFSAVCLCAGGIIAFSPLLIRLLAAESYYDAWRYIPILTLSMIAAAFSNFMGSVYVVTKKSTGIALDLTRRRGGSAGGIPELRRHRRLHRRRLDDRPDPGPARPVGHQLGGHFGKCPKHRRRSSQPDRPFILRRCHHGFYRHGFDRGAG